MNLYVRYKSRSGKKSQSRILHRLLNVSACFLIRGTSAFLRLVFKDVCVAGSLGRQR